MVRLRSRGCGRGAFSLAHRAVGRWLAADDGEPLTHVEDAEQRPHRYEHGPLADDRGADECGRGRDRQREPSCTRAVRHNVRKHERRLRVHVARPGREVVARSRDGKHGERGRRGVRDREREVVRADLRQAAEGHRQRRADAHGLTKGSATAAAAHEPARADARCWAGAWGARLEHRGTGICGGQAGPGLLAAACCVPHAAALATGGEVGLPFPAPIARLTLPLTTRASSCHVLPGRARL